MARSLPTTSADRWMAKGIAENQAHLNYWRLTKAHGLNAGLAFMKARSAVREGNFGLLLETYDTRIHRATVYKYIQFTEGAIEWAAQDRPDLRGQATALFEHAKTMVMQSPKPFVALLRELGEMRKFGEYDAVKYQRRRLLSGEQMELDFGRLAASIELLEQIDQVVLVDLPEGKTEDEALGQIEDGLEAALGKVRARRKTDLTGGNRGNRESREEEITEGTNI